MVVKPSAATCFHLTQPIVSHSHTVAAVASSPSLRRFGRSDSALLCRFVHRLDPSAVFGNPSSSRLFRSRSCDILKPRSKTLKRVCSGNLESFSDEEFSKKIHDLALRFQLSDENSGSLISSRASDSLEDESSKSRNNSFQKQSQLSWTEIQQDSPEWESPEEIIPAIIERKANSVDLPLSLRLIKRKLRWQEGFRAAGESAYCSVKKAFSSMVFIIRELQSYALQMRELLFYEDLQGILVRVQKEMDASFVWLFQQVFSHTPTLMVYVMILLANYSVYSMGSGAAFAASPPPATYEAVVEVQDQTHQTFDSSAVKTFSLSSSSGGKTTSIGSNNGGGGGKIRPAASGTEGDGWSERADQFSTVVPNGASQLSSVGSTRETESTSRQVTGEEELKLWNSVVEEAEEMEVSLKNESLDHETMQRFVSPVSAKIEVDNYADYLQTELVYQTGLSQDPNNALLLANYAQFLYLVAHDYDRAEEYFKKAVAVNPPDAEALSKYASFLWRARNDLWAAEEAFLEAISAEPTNSFYAANYAHFLWNTGGDDTCFPLSSTNTAQET